MPWITEFEPGIGETICKILRRGNFREMACAQVGITSQTLRNWLRRGVGPGAEEPFIQLVMDVERAEAEGEDLLITGIRRAGSTRLESAGMDRRAAFQPTLGLQGAGAGRCPKGDRPRSRKDSTGARCR